MVMSWTNERRVAGIPAVLPSGDRELKITWLV
jgi:hypothetical protein